MSSAGSPASGFFSTAFGNPYAGSPSAFTSPGMNPQALAALMAMRQGGGTASPTLPGNPMAPQQPGQPGAASGGMQQQPSTLQSMIQQMNPQQLQMLMQRFGQSGGAPAGATP